MTETPATATQSSMSGPRKTPTSFLDFPAELRNDIYQLALPTNQRITIYPKGSYPKRSSSKPPWSSHGLLAIGGQIEHEASAIYFGGNVFHVSCTGASCQFINFAGQHLKLVRHVELSFWVPIILSREVHVRRIQEGVSRYIEYGGTRPLSPDTIFVEGGGLRERVCLTEIPEFKASGRVLRPCGGRYDEGIVQVS